MSPLTLRASAGANAIAGPILGPGRSKYRDANHLDIWLLNVQCEFSDCGCGDQVVGTYLVRSVAFNETSQAIGFQPTSTD
jgi:hypothetical protein